MHIIITDPEEFPALLDHVCQAMSGSEVFIQVPLVWFSECLLPVHHPLKEEGKGKGHDEINNSDYHAGSAKKNGRKRFR